MENYNKVDKFIIQVSMSLSAFAFVLLVYWTSGGEFIRGEDLARAVFASGCAFVVVFVFAGMFLHPPESQEDDFYPF
jgi:hypothetical protein